MSDAAIPDQNDAATRAIARHEANIAYATVQQLSAVQSDVKSLKETIEGRVDGVTRVPGLVDLVGNQTGEMQAIKRILYGIFAVLAGNICLAVLQHFGILVPKQ